ncbi:Alcohol dehydrogenase, iron-type, conserved site [Lasallia pustulata]|uniref:Alcohol dehydrogenase, iron-type, conserved site n=1 Tax=Lasallia pustulata TaxID=136370 RepID=A0A1W5CZ54_9LECA|nr:Alcohol dehydrogenase, iron-type, conserved site [Lasallia pustulata]
MTEATQHPLSGLWKPTHLQRLHYGPSIVSTHLLSCLPTPTSKAFIITGTSLATKTSLIKQVEDLLGDKHHAGTFSSIKQHAPVAQLDEATDAVAEDPTIDTLISIGGGSPIDSAKAISYRTHEKTGHYLHHIAIPTTLSAAECTFNAGYTAPSGRKVSVAAPACAPHAILYDATFAAATPPRLWLSTGIRALDHAVELLYHPTATEVPARQMCLMAIEALYTYLPQSRREPGNEEVRTRLQLAAFASLYPLGTNVKGGLGLSHALGYALGSPYGIPHGITSCVTLAGVVRLKAGEAACAGQLARALPFVGGRRSGDDGVDAGRLADAVEGLVGELGLETRLGEYGVGEEEAGKIAGMAVGREEGDLYEKVVGLVGSKF